MRTVTLQDTLTGRLEPIVPEAGNRVRIYVCGPTVYGRVHVGNARPFVVFSLLKRFLVHEGYEVVLVSNITDINDKIYAAAEREGLPSAQLAAAMTAAYVADTDRLGLGRPDHEPLASETIDEIVALIGRLVQTGHAYPSGGDVYFSVRSYPGYGELSHRDVEQMDQGEGVDGAQLKRDPLDFALWKARKPGEDTYWDSPWGPGRPGWHIECSAMAQRLLGLSFEIHGGGSDLIFPHHENEAAQTRAAHGQPLARLWVHVGMVRLHSEKMSKSQGNVFMLGDALDRYGAQSLLMYFCAGHYRQPLEYDELRLREAAARAQGIRNAARRLIDGDSPEWSAPLRERFLDALAADFNTPRALAAVADWVRRANAAAPATVGNRDLREMLHLLGLESLLDVPAAAVDERAGALVAERERARAARDWQLADRLRDRLRELGWEVRDSPEGPQLVRATDGGAA
ncbi:MAG TPA: cysteine--tRNA ligase [Solirubrobacteraceae bacterium]|nr:cysteine--tRNA ligase [Solirubrobacteraceae bacterium]